MQNIALITGITGQDGSYLAELLLAAGYEVHGMVRRVALEAPQQHLGRLRNVLGRIVLHAGSLESHASVSAIVQAVKPTECYHLAAQSFVSYTFDDALSTFETNINGTLHLLSAIKDVSPKARFYFAATSEMFGKVTESPQCESTPFHPRSPYGISKLTGFELVRNFRELYGLHACSGILFNHESPRRGHEFVTRKITSAVARIKSKKETSLTLGNLEARRDWGYAADYVRAMKLMLEHDVPDDYVIATGQTHSVREFVELAFTRAGLNWQDHVLIDPQFYRPTEKEMLFGNASKARAVLGWSPTVQFQQLVTMMVDADLELHSK